MVVFQPNHDPQGLNKHIMTTIDWTAIRKSAIGDNAKTVLPPRLKLPMLPLALTQFMHAAEKPDADMRGLGKIIEKDTGLTTELLRYINSSVMGLRKKAATAQQALTLLGLKQSKLFLITSGVKAALSTKDNKLIHMNSFWATNLERALFAREIAGLLNADRDLAFAAAMLSDALLPILTNELTEHYVTYLSLPESGAPDLVMYERQKMGWDHAFVTAQVMTGWKFPDDLVVCLLEHHAGLSMLHDPILGKTAVAATAVASLIPDSLRQMRRGFSDLMKLDQVWPQFKLMEIAQRVEDQFLELSPGGDHPFSLLKRCLQVEQQDDTTMEDSLNEQFVCQ